MSEGVLAIDGPAGAGKPTAARAAAVALGIPVLDTGAMYRAVTLACLRAGVPLDDATACAKIAAHVAVDTEDGVTTLDGLDVSSEIRAPDVTAAVSVVSAHAPVRSRLVEHQRSWAERHGGGVVEGRDIGTVVFPDARLKVFLIASTAERAARRGRDEAAAGRAVALDALEDDIRRRDALDESRVVSPLVAAADAVQIDTTGRTLDDVVHEIIERFEAAGAARVARPISGAQP